MNAMDLSVLTQVAVGTLAAHSSRFEASRDRTGTRQVSAQGTWPELGRLQELGLVAVNDPGAGEVKLTRAGIEVLAYLAE